MLAIWKNLRATAPFSHCFVYLLVLKILSFYPSIFQVDRQKSFTTLTSPAKLLCRNGMWNNTGKSTQFSLGLSPLIFVTCVCDHGRLKENVQGLYKISRLQLENIKVLRQNSFSWKRGSVAKRWAFQKAILTHSKKRSQRILKLFGGTKSMVTGANYIKAEVSTIKYLFLPDSKWSIFYDIKHLT